MKRRTLGVYWDWCKGKGAKKTLLAHAKRGGGRKKRTWGGGGGISYLGVVVKRIIVEKCVLCVSVTVNWCRQFAQVRAFKLVYSIHQWAPELDTARLPSYGPNGPREFLGFYVTNSGFICQRQKERSKLCESRNCFGACIHKHIRTGICILFLSSSELPTSHWW